MQSLNYTDICNVFNTKLTIIMDLWTSREKNRSELMINKDLRDGYGRHYGK